MAIDFAQFYALMEQELRLSRDFTSSMLVVCDYLEQQVPHSAWNELRELDLNSDLQGAKEWLASLLQTAVCPFDVQAIYLGLNENMGEEDDYGNYGPAHADLYPVLFGEYEPTDDSFGWLFSNERLDIDDSNANLQGLRQAGLILNSSDAGVGYDCYLAYSVSYAVMLIRHLLDSYMYKLIQCKGAVGIATGFSSGDLFCLGELTEDGLVLRPGSIVAAVV